VIRLVIDDEVAIGKALERMLQSQHDITVLTDGSLAVAEATSAEEFDLIFCDVRMRNMSGVEVYQAIRASKPEAARRIVFMTAATFTDESRDFLTSVGNASISKPFTIDAIRSLVRDYVK
jgi:CheY-like chemotaxis protein